MKNGISALGGDYLPWVGPHHRLQASLQGKDCCGLNFRCSQEAWDAWALAGVTVKGSSDELLELRLYWWKRSLKGVEGRF